MKCIHIYQSIGAPLCSHCGKDTHEIDWDSELKLRRDYVQKVGILFQNREWWGI